MNIDFNKIPSPSFVLDEKLLLNNLKLLQYFQQATGVEIICALKGFSFYHVFPLLKQYLKGATASSLHEAMLVYNEMKCKAHSYCPVYLSHEFDKLQDISSHIVFNSVSDYNRFFPQLRSDIEYGLRVNPLFSEISTDLYNPASENSRLGIQRKDLPNILPDKISGLHFHVMCENNAYTLEKVLKHFKAEFHDLILQAKWINMGGGHLITDKNYDVEHGIKVLKGFRQAYPHLEKIILEPGSAIGWQTGYLVATILDIVYNGNLPTAMLDVSFTCHMPDCLEMPYQPKIVNSNESGAFTYKMGGMSCLAGDVMGNWSFDNELNVGDKIIFDDMIHYTMVKTTTFNGINLPNIGKWSNNEFQLLKSFDYEDYKRRL